MKKIIGFILFTVFFYLSFQVNSTYAAEIDRINGNDRYQTAVEISQAGWQKSSTVILAKGSDFPDALAGGPLAYSLNAPILLTNDKGLPNVTKQEIIRLGATKVILLGSEGAISKTIQDSLESMGLTIERIGGKTRFETAANIAKRLPSKQAIVVNGRNFPDALAVAPYAAKNGLPILLTDKDSIPSASLTIANGKSNTIIVGLEGAVSRTVEGKLKNPVRYGGSTRYATNKVLTEKLPMNASKAYIATGENFADALTGSVLAAKNDANILLVQQANVPSAIQSVTSKYNQFTIFGGTVAVSDGVKRILSGESTEFILQNIAIGDTEQHVVAQLGQPARKDLSRQGFYWSIYNKDYKKYIQVGIQNGKVVAIYSNSNSWTSKSGIKIGLTKSQAVAKLNAIGEASDFNEYTDYTTYYIDDKNYDATVYYDQHDNNMVAAVLLTAPAYTPYTGSYADVTESSDATKRTQLRNSFEKQEWDITNAYRVRYGKQPLTWDSKAGLTARNHSQDMINRSFFDHENPDGEWPIDRMLADDIDLSVAGENIAAGYFDPIEVHDGWVNSLGHRVNLLEPEYSHLGVGVAIDDTYVYYTQNFFAR
ncbi:cell wall-binding repeat-containing protein [Metabacillus niabensis]|uniref:Uncharacterized protein YkwD/putative cell wall-binding protein n=1 Tax=Metabacillus niabensis TaxID=324854 RepID=A0ABT9Z4S6_9BACI|nr:cell wall-binding repeat-containing protein [Metabacillus niabensis]MDQ0226822.1 uncharacterized protein YkwD/putative cell wall-binding protein [Metabacillus niabensis]